ncbi:MAG: a-glycosyltransferase, Glycosyltransferase Family 4-like protein [Pedosphaera sp.]|nr:a-glycosyltransferase, Glycosyltransferase Family 4-like protein [Pedosphaera sp.]
MRIVMFYHSVLSDWNHGNAHFLRGVATELLARGHEVEIYEPENAWSYRNLIAEHGQAPLRKLRLAYPALAAIRYQPESLDLLEIFDLADLVIVHEWNDHDLVRRIGEHHEQNRGYRLLFHDTHHRMVTDPESMAAYELGNYDGVLAYGRVLQELYLGSGRVRRAWTWHEGADTRVFFPRAGSETEGDLVWIGNWGDGERTAEITEFLIEPIQALSLKARFHGVCYPDAARKTLEQAGIKYDGWLSNVDVPGVFGRFKATVHVPRRPYVKALPGIPTIRVFEALACGIPLVCSPWDDAEGLFRPGQDFLIARNGKEMAQTLRALLHDRAMARELARNGLETLRSRHTCAHRVDELLAIDEELRQPVAKTSRI